MITSDGVNARLGTLTSNEERFMLWRTIDGQEIAPLAIPQLEVLLRGVFDKNIFLDLIKHFILFQTDGNDIYKILAGFILADDSFRCHNIAVTGQPVL